MESQISNMHVQDCAFLCTLIICFWGILLFVVSQVSDLESGNNVRTVLYIAATALGAYAAIGTMAVLKHTTRNRVEIYTQEIECLG